MGFISFVGRFFFICNFLLSVPQDLDEFGAAFGGGGGNIAANFQLLFPNVEIKHIVVAATALNGIGCFLFIFGSPYGAYLLLTYLAITSPVLYDRRDNFDVKEPQCLIRIWKNLAFFGTLLFFLEMNKSIMRSRRREKIRRSKICTSIRNTTSSISLQQENNSDVAEEEEGGTPTLGKKAAKKLEKLQRQQEAAAAAAALTAASREADPLSENYGEVPLQDLQSKPVTGRIWTEIGLLNESFKDKTVLVRGRIQTTRTVGKNIGFLVLRGNGLTIQCVLTVAENLISRQMVKFATSLTSESFVDIEGIVSVPDAPIKGATQQFELQVRKIHCISKPLRKLPYNIVDAARSEADIEKALQAGEQLAHVTQDTRLNFRVIDIRTPANQGIISIQSHVEEKFRQYLLSKGFRGVHTPKILAGSSEGGASVFRLDYKGRPACLAQSPQLHKQMAICGDCNRVFEVGPVFRAEDAFTNRHLCQFTGLDLEMMINEHYSEVMDLVDGLFVAIFDSLNENCKEALEAIGKQYPFEPLKYRRKTLRLTYEEGVQMLKEAGFEVKPLGDLNTEAERKLGKLVLEKYGTEFYILHRYPLAVRPFYTMPCYDNHQYSNSFDVFIRGEEIISGAQRVHDADLLISRAQMCGINLKSIETYIDAFRYGAPPHGGFGVGLERVVMLFCALNNIRKTSLFPRDPKRLEP